MVAGPETTCVSAAAAALESSGVRLATVTSLPDGRVSNVDAQPQVTDSLDARRAAARIADYLAACMNHDDHHQLNPAPVVGSGTSAREVPDTHFAECRSTYGDAYLPRRCCA